MEGLDAETSSQGKYEVFLSFRGCDTRHEFVDFLYHSLTDAGIYVFRDDKEHHVGERIDGSYLQAINNSRIYIPIFSRNYASSLWCLHELSQIVEKTSKSEGNREILPIFFDVMPDDVRLKTQLYSNDILHLEHEKKLSNEEVDAWREALQKVSERKGWEVKKYDGQGELILLIVSVVLEKLEEKHNFAIEHLVGIDDRFEEVIKLLDVNSSGVRLIKIYGMGGIGKTTLTKVIFKSLSSHFGKFCCFLEDVRANSSKRNGLVELQKKLVFEIGSPTSSWRSDEIDYGMEKIGEALRDKKVLIVLDDVDNSEQVEKLVGENILCSGSRILISTRNEDVLQTNTSEYQLLKYEMEVMNYDQAYELFNWHAFHNDSPSYDYIDLSKEIISTTGRLPLALEVIGSFLYQKSQDQWENTLDKLRKALHKDVFVKLKISYDALSYRQQQIFLDIACFLIGEDMTNALYMWKDCEFLPTREVTVLIKLSLVKILNNTFWMHDQLRDLGREIVRQESPENPGEWSRIWTSGEVLDATKTKKMNRNVQALSFDSYAQNFEDHVVLSKEIGKFEHLRFLKLLGGTFAGDLADCLPNLRWISWYFPQQIYKWTNMYLKNVVVLEFTGVDSLDDSRLRDLIERARKLKVFSLKSCHSIMTTPNFSKCPSLERLTFEDCSNLSKIDGSIGELRHLIDLKIDKCSCLKDLPKEIGDLMRLKHFFVQRCPVKKLPDSIWQLKSLQELHFSSSCFALVSTDLWELPSSIEKLENLEVLIVNSLNLKGRLPSMIGILPILRILNLSNTQVNEVPKTIRMLSCLQVLELMACHNIQELPALPTSLTHLRVSSASLRAIPNLSNLTNLVRLDLIIVNKEEINSVSMSDGVLGGYSS